MATSSLRNCKNERNNICYICGEYTAKKKQYTINKHIGKHYTAYFDTKVDVATWAQQYCCTSCSSPLSNRLYTGYPMPFVIPMIWHEPQYQCLLLYTMFAKKPDYLLEEIHTDTQDADDNLWIVH